MGADTAKALAHIAVVAGKGKATILREAVVFQPAIEFCTREEAAISERLAMSSAVVLNVIDTEKFK